jgi:3-oxoacyl-[acyl-carrier-protein] synthase-3
MPGVRIAGLGKYLPQRVLTNDDLARMVDTSDEWIRARSGIRERHLASDEETASSMGLEAARRALAMAGMEPDSLDLVLTATTTPDGLFPSAASLIQDGLKAYRAGAFDINAACTGFLAALATGSQFIATGASRRVLVIGTEVLSRIVDWTDRATCVIFGDGAGALVLEAAERGGPLGIVLRSDGGGVGMLNAPGPCGRRDLPVRPFLISMDGRHVFKFAVNAMEEALREALHAANLSPQDIDLFVPHQANLRIINAATRALHLPPEKVMINIQRYGNTSSASIPIALCEAWEEGRLHEGQRVALASFGGGLAWGAIVLEWAQVGPPGRPAARLPAEDMAPTAAEERSSSPSASLRRR